MVYISHLATAALLFTSVLVNSAPAFEPTNIAQSLIHKRADSSESVIITKCTQPGTLALTFDDGPYIFTEELLNTLKTNNVKATFFVNGHNYVDIQDTKYAKLIESAKSDGHQIASHTWDHADLATLSKEKILAEMDQLNDALKLIIGVVPTFMRPPYGSTNALVRETLIEAGYTIVNWDVDIGDSAGKSEKESEKLYEKLATSSNTQAGHIVLQHDVYKPTALSLAPKAIALLKNKFQLVTVGACLGVAEESWYRSY
ncbi:chitin deacetylase [Mortierella antarctica]|nr:chitin deacetylase [Mortierella antarctica]